MKVCPVCEGYTSSRLKRCGTCDVPMVDLTELSWVKRDEGGVASSPWIGHLVGGKYRITGVLGRGGMGTVYRAVHELSLSPAAVKVLHPRFAKDARYRNLLMAEARRASRVRGEHIAQVLDVGETQEGSIYIAMELVEGETLQTFLAREGRMEPAHVLSLLDLTCQALEEMGRAGLVHRDVSPANLMLTRRGRNASLKILDLGIAQIPEEPEEKASEMGSGLWINPPYTAPEVLEGATGTQQSDLYSLGVVAYQALTGRLPHGGETTQERVQAVIQGDAAPMELPRGTPRRLGMLIRRLMARDPSSRPQTATEVIARVRLIRRPRRTLQRAASITLFLGGLIFLTLSMTKRTEAVLLARPTSIRLSSVLPGLDTKSEALRLDRLRRQTFEAHGVGPGDLVLDCLYEDGTSGTYVLEGRRKGQDLSFDVEGDPGWRAFYKEVSAKGGQVTLSFRREGRSLAHARLFVDREDPSLVDARLEGSGEENVLLRDSIFVARVEEDGSWVEASFQLMDAQDHLLHRFTKQIGGSGPLRVELGRELSGKPGTASGDPATLKVSLRDRAGRTSTPWSRILKHVDLSLPEIRQAVSAEGSEKLFLAGKRCEILLWLSSEEEPVDIDRIEVRVGTGADDALRRIYTFDAEPGKIRFHMDLEDLERVLLEFQLVDKLGNKSKIFRQSFEVRVLDLRSTFSSRLLSKETQSPFLFTQDDRQLLLEKAPFLLVYECNPEYEPQLITQGLPPAVVVQDSKPGLCTILLGASLDAHASFVLRFRHRNVVTGRVLLRSRDLEVRLLPEPPFFFRRSDWIAGRKWSGQLVKAGFLEGTGPDEFRILLDKGLGLVLDPEAQAKAWLWRAGDSGWTRVSDLSSRSPRVELYRGRNRFALEAVDLLHRTLVDKTGLKEEVRVGQSKLLPFLDFRHDSRKPRSRDIFFEYGSPVRLSLDFPQAFEPGTRVSLTPSWQRADMEPAVVLELQPTLEGGSRGTTILDPDKVRRWCGLEGVSKQEFGKHEAIKRRFRLRTPAGEHPDIELLFQPTRSLLRVQDLALLSRSHKRKVMSWQKMVPFLGTEKLLLGLVKSKFNDLPGTLLVDEQIRVDGLEDFYLSQTEVSRRDYERFVKDILAGKTDAALVKRLGHAEDPLGALRFTEKGLMPWNSLFPGKSLGDLVKADADRPLTGVDYYQASAYCRWLSDQVFGNPDMLRLPFAAELVLAAVHRFPDEERSAHLNGLQVPGLTGRSVEQAWRLHRRLARGRAGLDPRRWPLSRQELEAVGDFSLGLPSVDGVREDSRCYGIDFGVREWVEDLPLVGDLIDDGVVRILIGNHSQHLLLARDRREGKEKVYKPENTGLGVIRGLGFAEPAIRGRDPLALGYLRVPGPKGSPASFGDRALLGVRRTENAKRDGFLSGESKNPSLGVVGFRIAGTRKFMEKARMGQQ